MAASQQPKTNKAFKSSYFGGLYLFEADKTKKKMLKVKTVKGKFDIVLNEDKLSEARPTDRTLKGRTKGLSSKSSNVRTSHGSSLHVGSKNQVTNVGHGKKNEKGKHEIKGQLRDQTSGKKTHSRKDLATEGASYLTKDQLSKILSSLKSDSQDRPPPVPGGSSKSEVQETSIHQPSTADDQQCTDLVAHAPEVKTAGFITNPAEQTSRTEKQFQWKMELDKQLAMKQRLKEKQSVLSKESKMEEYDPWGRPGGGAPVRIQSGNVVTDYKKMVKNEVHVPPGQVMDNRPRMKTTGQASSSHSTEVPAAMRSSFAVGAPGVVQYKTDQSKAEEKKKWLLELEQQIREKKEREAQEKLNQSVKEARHDSWHQRTVPSESSASVTATSGSVIPLTVESSVTQFSGVSRAVNVHARGHGLQSLGQKNQDEMERKRMKTLEHHLAIKEQVEEKRRLKQEEKERMMREEAEKERSLAEERKRLQIQYEEELMLRQEKEEEAKRRADALHQSVSHAYESAQQEKAAKRIKHLEAAGHDVSRLKSRLESISPRENQAGLGALNQDTGVRQSTRIHTDGSSYFAEKNEESHSENVIGTQASSRIGQDQELPKEKESAMSLTRQKDESFEAELKEISLNTSLESQWAPRSSSLSNARSDSQAKSLIDSSPSPRKDKVQKAKTIRSQSERSQRKQHKQLRTKRSSLENVTQEVDIKPPPPLMDAFIIPYRRTSSATFHIPLDTPSSHQETPNNRSKPTTKKIQSDQTAEYRKGRESTTKATSSIRKDTTRAKVSTLRGAEHGTSSKTIAVSRMTEKRNVKQDKANKKDGKSSSLHPVQLSPEPLPTARQEMILKQLATLRQGLMMKERELHYST